MKLITQLKHLKNNEGLTLKKYKPVYYRSGWQVATEGKEATTPALALEYIQAYGGNCGVWYSEGVYYIDLSHRVATKREALAIGRACHQQSILKWQTMGLVWC